MYVFHFNIRLTHTLSIPSSLVDVAVLYLVEFSCLCVSVRMKDLITPTFVMC